MMGSAILCHTKEKNNTGKLKNEKDPPRRSRNQPTQKKQKDKI